MADDGAALRWVEDQLALRDLVARLAHLADDGDLDDYARCFTVDAIWVPPADAGVPVRGAERVGLADILVGATERRADGVQGPGSHTMHVVTTVSVERRGPDHAVGRAYWRYYADTDASPRLISMGRYDDTYAREPSGWKLASRRIVRS